MSFLDRREREFNWIAAPSSRSLRQAPGCVQCGRGLDSGDLADGNLSGKCLSCLCWVSEDGEVFDELEG